MLICDLVSAPGAMPCSRAIMTRRAWPLSGNPPAPAAPEGILPSKMPEIPREHLDWEPPPGYRTQDLDTSPQVERLWFDLQRQLPVHERIRKFRALNRGMVALGVIRIRRRFPAATDLEVQLRLASETLDRDTMIRAFGAIRPGEAGHFPRYLVVRPPKRMRLVHALVSSPERR